MACVPDLSMSDPAFRPLLDVLLHGRGQTVWVTDEQLDAATLAAVLPRAGLAVLSNRCDGFHALQQRGLTALLGDFSFDGWAENSLDAVAFRIAKEKAIVHHVINAALSRLRPGGELWLCGGKNEGIKTYLDKAAAMANGSVRSERHGQNWLGVVTRGVELGAPLDDQRYTEWREIPLGDERFAWSKPGIYGWQKVDTGSALLSEQLAAVWPQPPGSVLDLGCGYGFLSLHAAQRWPHANITATDNNFTAVRACEKNLACFNASSERATTVLADCGNGIEQRFDAVLCNPPFHQGFDVETDLTTRFLQSARRLLHTGNRPHENGRALFVVNQFIALERKAAPLFRSVNEVCRAQGFKVLVLDA
jgi:16S rRNA (guanine1207-N2)-methyltransferase